MPTSRRPLVWSASLPVCVAGWLIAHSLAYRLIAAADGGHGVALEGTGHGDVAFSPYLIALSVAIVLLALAGAVIAGATRRTRPPVPLAPYLLLPLVDFASHSVLEYLHSGQGVATGAAPEPVFLVGLALQVPLGLAALLLARAGLAWAEGLGRGMTPRWRPGQPALASPALPKLLIGTEHRPIVPALASGCAQRGPPAALVR